METWDGDRIRARALSGSVFLTNALWGLRPVAVWEGDAGYDDGDLNRAGARHRLYMRRGAWRYDGGADVLP